MTRFGKPSAYLLLMAACVLGLLPATAAHAVEVTVESQGNQQYANINESGISFATSALYIFLVTQNGVGVDLGTGSIGDGTYAVSLPTGISISPIIAPIGGCGFTYTQFVGSPDGYYYVRLVPFAQNASCKWVAGDYLIRLKIDRNGYQGQDLGTLTIK